MSTDHAHPEYLGHHYDTPEQQFHSGKLGMWLFLATEVLLFAGLFCAYAIYRSHHPEVFVYADHFLDRNLGALNTGILIFSSFTMAMAVRQAQVGQNRQVIVLLAITLLCGCGFLAVKKIEYEAKWKHGLLWGTHFQPEEHGNAVEPGTSGVDHATSAASHESAAPHESVAATATSAPVDPGPLALKSTLPAPSAAPGGLVPVTPHPEPATAGSESHAPPGPRPNNVHIFFGIYFLMTGLHGIHVIAGMSAIAWVLVRTMKGHFSAAYSTPIDLVGLYWHLVDLIWIYLFPLLYLIH